MGDDTLVQIARSARSVVLVLIVLSLGAIIVVAWRARTFLMWEQREKLLGTDADQLKKGEMRRRWRMIESQLKTKSKGAYKLAVIEADKIVDTALEKHGFRGDTMADKLNQIKTEDIKNLDQLWEAHRIRNSIVHDMDSKVPSRLAQKAVKIFKDTLEELGVL